MNQFSTLFDTRPCRRASSLVEPWSNGQTEDQITRLKIIKRQMYGQAKLDLLEVQLIGAE